MGNPELRALIIRKNSKDLSDWCDRANRIYSLLGAVRSGSPPKFTWPSGAVFSTGHLMDANAYTQYQGHEYQKMVLEELDQIPEEKHYLELMSSCRSTVDGLKPQIFLTSNPGGRGHGWVKARFVDPMPPNTRYATETELPDGRKIELDRVFIPATMDDNPALMEKDPAYVARIEQLKEKYPDKYKAWRYGDWDIFAGQVFSEFRRDTHVINRMKPKRSLTHFLWTDWGITAPFATYATALVEMKSEDGQKFNRLITYQEWYESDRYPEEWAEILWRTAKQREFRKWVVDPSMVNSTTDGSVDMATTMVNKWKLLSGKNWISPTKGNNRRPSQVPIMKNWMSLAPDGMAYWLITEDCINLIRTLPTLVYDDNKVEEVDTSMEDHCLVGDTLVLTDGGWKQIKDLPCAEVTGHDTIVIDLITESGKKISCTPNHKILCPSGWVESRNLKVGDMILSLSLQQSKTSEGKDSTGAVNTIHTNQKNRTVRGDYIGLFGNFSKVKSRKPSMSTTRMETSQTIGSKTSNLSESQNTCLIIPLSSQSEGRKRVEETPSGHAERVISECLRNNAVERLSWVGNERREEKVYDIGINHPFHGFIVNGGIIVHNSFDACTYGLKEVKWIGVKAGAFGLGKPKPKFKVMADMKDGKQMSLDTDAFTKRVKKRKSWKSL